MHLSALRPCLGLLIVASLLSVSSGASAQSQERPVPRLTPRLRPRPAPAEKPSPQPPASRPTPSPAEESPKEVSAPQATPPIAPPNVVEEKPAPLPTGAGAPPVLLPYRHLSPPSGYVEKKRFNVALLGGGGLVLGITYGASIVFAATQNFENGLGNVFVPIVGPWIAIGQRDFTCDVDTSPTLDGIEGSTHETQQCVAQQTQTAAFLVGLGVGQLVGASLLTVGLLDRRRTWLRADLAHVKMDFDVVATPHFSGLFASGSF